jgi:hypothetical protein
MMLMLMLMPMPCEGEPRRLTDTNPSGTISSFPHQLIQKEANCTNTTMIQVGYDAQSTVLHCTPQDLLNADHIDRQHVSTLY